MRRMIAIHKVRVAALLVLSGIVLVALSHRLPTDAPPTATSSTKTRAPSPPRERPHGSTGHLDPALLDALRAAAGAAAGDGVAIVVNSGWRSPEKQAELFREAVAKYGSEAEAARWVAPPERSEHVKGQAVDVAKEGAAWLSEHGAAYGLCRVYRNEPWHFELRPGAAGGGCPAMYADAAHDPRLWS